MHALQRFAVVSSRKHEKKHESYENSIFLTRFILISRNSLECDLLCSNVKHLLNADFPEMRISVKGELSRSARRGAAGNFPHVCDNSFLYNSITVLHIISIKKISITRRIVISPRRFNKLTGSTQNLRHVPLYILAAESSRSTRGNSAASTSPGDSYPPRPYLHTPPARIYRDRCCIHARMCIHSRSHRRFALCEFACRRAPRGIYRSLPSYKVDTYSDVEAVHPAWLGAMPLNQFRHIPRHNPPQHRHVSRYTGIPASGPTTPQIFPARLEALPAAAPSFPISESPRHY